MACKMSSPALFLDRDGVIVEEKGYIVNFRDIKLIKGSANLIKKANKIGLKVFIVTNQSAIARGLLKLSTYKKISDHLEFLLKKKKHLLQKPAFHPFI